MQGEIFSAVCYKDLSSFRRFFKCSTVVTPAQRGGTVNSESPINGSFSQPKPCRIRPTEEQPHEKDEKESRTGIQGQHSPGSNMGQQDIGGVAEQFDVHPKQISEWKQ